MRRILVGLLGCVAVVGSGCGVERVSVHWNDPGPRRTVVHIDDGHVCSSLCHDHYWDGSRVVVLSGHRHHSGCGHDFRGGHWVVVAGRGDRLHVTDSHRCGHDCHHHYWDGGKLVVLKGHRHGPGCGHVFHDGRWNLSVSLGGGQLRLGASHICGSGCHDHFWNGSTHVILKGHRHRPGCGHVFSNSRWLVAKSSPQKAKAVETRGAAPSSRGKAKTEQDAKERSRGNSSGAKKKKPRSPADRP